MVLGAAQGEEDWHLRELRERKAVRIYVLQQESVLFRVEGIEMKDALITIGAVLLVLVTLFCLCAVCGMGWQVGKMIVCA